ncbi:hypothetical protein AMJ48_00975 [Parcubacteria bacterium DG_74_1]|nr:MAG: hypothetical protein AMJ48_00975 [Parcubacteria bacterium DG_74_1]
MKFGRYEKEVTEVEHAILFIRAFAITFLIRRIIEEAMAGNLGWVLIFSIILVGYLIWIYRTRKSMFLPAKHTGTGKNP